ncbi:TRAP transporter large permease [Devosia faecipullorum]|uniref:TRAP transporter large permease n=1 Tax=Devosia faecipullorum TaxID=2755039 RepID=UPI00187BC325|nr:TRAP transporter large permease [Devosia faecipullorum]MBE7731755.1 TRAP transporter large permease [Devosia faecipullorum]
MIPTTLGLLFGMLAIGLPIGAVMLLLALGLDWIFSPMPLILAAGELSWVSSSNYLLVSVPLFVLLGEILLRAGIADRLYGAIVQWIGWLPGGLMHANIGASTAFAATSGSSVATAATISVVAKPMIARHGYNERLFYGSIAAGGTLGILIPPSINLILYGWLTSTSVPALYMAGIVPGVILALVFSLAIIIFCIIRPGLGGQKIETSWKSRLESLPSLLPPLFIFAVIIGSIYMGIATPTESAALGVASALLLAGVYRQLSWRMLLEAIDGTMRTTGMIMLIVMAAWFLNFVISAMGLVTSVNAGIVSLGLEPMALLAMIILIYLVLGCFMDPLPMMIVTVPVLTPLVVSAGFDPIWFGIIIVLLCEMALITPPIGMNLFVVQGVRRRGSLVDIMIGVLPFMLALLAMIALVIAFPQIALWLPELIRG